jgi:hypothetical protein
MAAKEIRTDVQSDQPQTAGEPVNRRADGADMDPASENTTDDVTVSMASMKISAEQGHPAGHGHSVSVHQTARQFDGNERAHRPQQGQVRHDDDGWRSVYDAVMCQPPENVIDSVVKRCGAEWYRLGMKLGYNDDKLRSLTFDIPSPESKLQAVIERKRMEAGTGEVVKKLLDVCEQLMPLTVMAIMEDLGIEYNTIVSDRLLYEVGKEIGQEWKLVARHLGLTTQDMADIKMKAKSGRKRAWKMLQLWYTRVRSRLGAEKIAEILQGIRKCKLQEQKSKIYCLLFMLTLK